MEERHVTDPLVEDYLRRLGAAADVLGPERRSELVAGIREHIEAALASGEVHDEASLRVLLDRLGDPDEIVAAALADDPTAEGTAYPHPAATVAYRPAGIGLEIAAAVFLTLGSVLFVIGWLVGVVLVWASRRWTLGEKLLATLVLPGGPAAALWLGATVSGTTTCTSSSATDGLGGPLVSTPMESCTTTGLVLPPVLGVLAFVAWIVLPVVVAVVLVARARRRADLEPPVPVRAGSPSRWGGLEIAAVLLLSVGVVVPVVGVVAGLACAWMSEQWTRNEKWVATVIASAGLLVLPVLAAAVLAVSKV